MKNRLINFLGAILVFLASIPAFSHDGHGFGTGDSLYHYVFSAWHLFPFLALSLVILYFFAFRKKSQANKK